MNTLLNCWKSHSSHKGFTLLEIMLVLAGISILSSIVILVFDPLSVFGRIYDTQRTFHLREINDALEKDHIYTGKYNNNVNEIFLEICDADGNTSQGNPLEYCIELEDIDDIPRDPSFSAVNSGTGYFIRLRPDSGDDLELCAPYAQANEVGINNTLKCSELVGDDAGFYAYFGGNVRAHDVTDVDEVIVELDAAGGVTNQKNPPGNLTSEYTKAGYGGKAIASLDVSEINELEVYVGGTGGEEIEKDPHIAGWGWKKGGDGVEMADQFYSGAGGGASAIINDEDPIIVTDGGGGGMVWDTYTFLSGGGGARGGISHTNNWGTPAENGEGNGYGGDGGYGNVANNANSAVPATDGSAEVMIEDMIIASEIMKGEGAKDNEHGKVIINNIRN